MSAKCHRADIVRDLFDHLVGAREQLWWQGEAQCLGRFEVDREVKLVRLYHRQIAGLGAFENAAGVDADLPGQLSL